MLFIIIISKHTYVTIPESITY